MHIIWTGQNQNSTTEPNRQIDHNVLEQNHVEETEGFWGCKSPLCTTWKTPFNLGQVLYPINIKA